MLVYECREYREFFQFKIQEHGRLRGYQKQMAEAAGCQSSFLSHVLNSHVQLTPDQAAGLADFWKLNGLESEYFVSLVGLERSSSPLLKKILRNRLAEIKNLTGDLARRFQAPHNFKVEDEVDYFTSWYNAAVHMLTTIPKFRAAKDIAQKLRLPLNLVQTTLSNLESKNLVMRSKSGWAPTKTNIHLPRDSKLNATNHASWRQFMLQRLQERNSQDLHYTAIHTLSIKDVEVFKNLLVECIEKTRKLVDPSPEEELVCFVCDFFQFD